MLGPDVELVECQSFDQVFADLSQGIADLAVLPVENSIVGEIVGVTDLLRVHKVSVRERFWLKIDHVLAGVPGATLDDIRTVSSHPEALKQCHRFLATRTDWKVTSGGDTASCVRHIAERGSSQDAAIGSSRAAMIFAISCAMRSFHIWHRW